MTSTNLNARVDEKDSDRKYIFKPDDLTAIVERLQKYKNDKLNPHLFLIPLIALYQGMRVNEICQLDVSDIVLQDGLWCINNNETTTIQSQSDPVQQVEQSANFRVSYR